VGKSARIWKRLRDDEHDYGFAEKTGRLDKRGNKLGGYAYAMWNSDTFGYMGDTDPIYASVPFFLVLRNGRTHGVFLDNTSRTTFDNAYRQSPSDRGARSCRGRAARARGCRPRTRPCRPRWLRKRSACRRARRRILFS